MATIPFIPRPLVNGHWLAEKLGVSYVTIKRWSSEKRLADLQIPVGGQIKYDPEQVEQAIRSGRLASKAA